jgi:hypothetical protein
VLGGLAVVGVWQFRRFAPVELPSIPVPQTSWLGDVLDVLARLFWFLFRWTGRLTGLAANMLEGDGGLLWTLLLLVLLLSIFRGQ